MVEEEQGSLGLRGGLEERVLLVEGVLEEWGPQGVVEGLPGR